METSCQTTPDLMAVRSAQAVRIGIVEDQAGVAESLKKLINRADGFQVVGTYPNGEAALEQIPGHKPDLVFMDIGRRASRASSASARSKRCFRPCRLSC